MPKKITQQVRTCWRTHYDNIAAGRCKNDFTDHFFMHFGMRSTNYETHLDLSKGYENRLPAGKCNGFRLI